MTGLDVQDPRDQRAQEYRDSIAERGLPPALAQELNRRFAAERDNDLFNVGGLGGVGGFVAGAGKGVVEGGMSLARGLHWLANAALPGSTPLGDDNWSTDLRDYLGRDTALKLESRLSQNPFRTASEMTGDMLTLFGSGGMSAVGKVATLPGRTISALSAPVVKLGMALGAASPKLGKWAKTAGKVTEAAGVGTGFGLYNYATAEGGNEERAMAGLHGLLAGAGLHVLGGVARAVEKKILSFGTKTAEREALASLYDDIASHKKRDIWTRAKQADAALVATLIEGTGIAGLNEQFWKDLANGAQGDGEAMKRAAEVYAASVAGVLFGRTGKGDIWKSFRREAPELNTLEPRLQALEIEIGASRDSQGPRGPQDPGKPPMESSKEVDAAIADGALKNPEPAAETAYRLPALSKATDPLFKSGWDLKPEVEFKDGVSTITMEFPGTGAIRMWENEGQAGPAVEAFGLEVPVDVFRQVRGNVQIPEGVDSVRLVGPAAEEFVQHLTAVSLLRRIRGELHFGQGGEAWAGGPWRAEDGRWHSIGLDGKHYSRSPLDEAYKPDSDPTMPVVDNPHSQDPQFRRWTELMQVMAQHTAPTPGRDLLEASIALAVNGDPNSRSVQELVALLGQEWVPGALNADVAGAMLRPETIDQFGLTVGQVAAGHLTAERAAQQIGTVLAGGGQTGTQLPAPQEPGQAVTEPVTESGTEVVTDAVTEGGGDIAGSRDVGREVGELAARFRRGEITEQEYRAARDAIGDGPSSPAPKPPLRSGQNWKPGSQDVTEVRSVAPEEIAGGRDWSSATPAERRDAARAYASVKPTTTAGEMSRTFLIPRETARDILGRGREGEAGAIINPVDAAVELAESVGEAVAGGYESLTKPQMLALADRGGDPGRRLSEEYREIATRRRALLGASGEHARAALRAGRGQNLVGRNEAVTTPQGIQYETRRYRNLIEGRGAQPANPEEAEFGQRGSNALLVMQHTAAGAGGMRNTAQGYQPMTRMSRATVPYHYASDYHEMLEHPGDRQAFYRELERLNPNTTAAALEAAYLNRQSARDVDNPESVAAYEIQRQLHHIPATFAAPSGRTYEILEGDPAVALHSILEKQSGRTAMMQVIGQDLPAAVRQQHGIQRPGITERLRQFSNELEQVPGIRGKKDVRKLATDIAERLQGREPHPLSRAGRAFAEIMAVPRAFGAWASGVYDIPGFITEPQVYVGMRNMLRALRDVVTGRPHDAARFGSLAHELGNVDLGAAQTPLQRLAELISTPSNWLERTKTSFFDRVARVWVEQMRRDPRSDDYETLTDLLKFSEADANALLSGNAPQVLYDQARRELVVRMANRGRPEERSSVVANPTVRNWFRYLSYGTHRLDQIANEAASAARRLASPRSTMEQRANAIKRVVYRLSGVTFGGLMASAIAMVLADLFRGENGVEHFARNVSNYPGKTLLSGSIGQLASGPYGMIASSAMQGDPDRLASTVEGLNVIASLVKSFSQGSGNVFDTAGRVAADLGIIPRQARDLWMTGYASMLGSSEYASLARVVNEWHRLEGKERAFGERDKQPEFYDAMRSLHEKVAAQKGDERLDVQAEIDKALKLQPGDAVAAKIRSMRFLPQLDPKERRSLLKYAGEERTGMIVHHDEALTALAREVGRKAGTYTADWDEGIETSAKLAAAGTSNAWSQLIDRAVAEAREQELSGTPARADITELAMAMADYPQSVAKQTGLPDYVQELATQMSRPDLSNIIAAALSERAYETAKDERAKRAMEEK